ncbi:glutamate--tRNA ligase [Ructibacterium gallinarum]|uniref:Glutamate--tRNA ligase n=1 Tax=Ructibacterium gallinarum TaxID=2779355 RepID=A0A9D5R8N6_9FIRM|nr:glutamate--tRNA ligase [Ructibacterium gallinarum]MBE5040180.1 glutamate--tRNA ligase [Ructibacterium gallinarum]
MDYTALAELLFPQIDKNPEDYEQKYPLRDLPDGAMVTRIGPSPTGFVHLGNLYNAMIGERLAHQSGGTFYLRVEDTDAKREVPGAVELVLSAMDYFGIHFDEGADANGDRGNYGPYRQRQRKEIYQCFAKELVRRGLAYPCFCTEERLAEMRSEQMANKENFGYYGKWALCRDLSFEEIKERIAAGESYVLRFRSEGNIENTVELNDGIRGILHLQENYQDFVLLKSDGIPTYHFAHVVDDHLMRTTHVVRGEEWLSTAPMHLQLFDTFGWIRPVYCHTPVLMKMDGETKRKLSKRKDPELGLDYYRREGYVPEAVREYLMTVLNSNFEEWRSENPELPMEEFPFSLEKMSNSGALFDMMKFDNVSQETLLRLPASEIYEKMAAWLSEYDPEFAKLFTRDRAFSERIIDVGRSGNRPRKDLTNWKQARQFLSFYFGETFAMEDPFPERVSQEDRKEILARYLAGYDASDDNSAWFEKIRQITGDMGYAVKPKDYKKNPEQYKGSITDVSNVIRVAVVGRTNSPDLWEICQIIGEEAMKERIRAAM